MSLEGIIWAFEQDIPKASSKFVLVALGNYANPQGHAYPSNRTICRITSLHEDTVRLALADLINSGYISDTGKRNGMTGQVVVYQLGMEIPETERPRFSGVVKHPGKHPTKDPVKHPVKHPVFRGRSSNGNLQPETEDPPYPPRGELALAVAPLRAEVLEAVALNNDLEVIPRKPKAAQVPEVPLVIPAVLAASPAFVAKWEKWVAVRRGMKKVKDWSGLFQEQLQFLSGYSPEVATQILSNSIMGGWQGLFEPKSPARNGASNHQKTSIPNI